MTNGKILEILLHVLEEDVKEASADLEERGEERRKADWKQGADTRRVEVLKSSGKDESREEKEKIRTEGKGNILRV